MDVLANGFGNLASLIGLVLWFGLLVLKGAALIDCVRRPAQAFPAIDRQTKNLWLLLTGLSLALHIYSGRIDSWLNLAGTVVSIIYWVDVRVKIKSLFENRW